jgi:hypothetical protein
MKYLVAVIASIAYVLLDPLPAGVRDMSMEGVAFTPPEEGVPDRRDGGGTR